MIQRVCAVIGVGPGNGAAIARKFANERYSVALCARDLERLQALTTTLPNAHAYAYDVADPEAAGSVFSMIERDLGPVDVVVYNAGSGTWGSIDEIDVDAFQSAWEVNTRGLFQATQAVLPQMRRSGHGSIVVIGATASIRGGAKSFAFASAKAAQRSLAQSMARHLGPEKIHVGYVILDGIVDLETTKNKMSEKPGEFFLSSEQIAQSVYFLATQPEQAWSFELDLRPFGESW